jgi:proline dehydrogenase
MPVKPNISFENLEIAFASKTNRDLKKMYLIFATINNNMAVSVAPKWPIGHLL